MKIHVTLRAKFNSETHSSLDLIALPSDTVGSLKEKLTDLQQISFPEQQLRFEGANLREESSLSACGVKEGSSLILEIQATDAVLAQQLAKLLEVRNLPLEELSSLYCYKYGATTNQALKLLGFDGKLQDFIAKQKCLLMNNGSVMLAHAEESIKPVSTKGDSKVRSLATSQDARGKKGIIEAQPMIKSTIIVDAPVGLVNDLEITSIDSQQLMDLHNRIHSRSFKSKVTQAMNALVGAISAISILNIDHVAIGGSVGKGTAISGVADAEVVLFLSDLSTTAHEMLQAIGKVIEGSLQEAHRIQNVCIMEDHITMYIEGAILLNVDLYISPVFENYHKALEGLAELDPYESKSYCPSLVQERTQFVARQPSSVKATIRLIKWWRDQQKWSSNHTRPSDELLELTAIYSAVQLKPVDQQEAIANLLALFCCFSKSRVVWSNYYNKNDVPRPLLRQRPLLMDPTNPYVNVADPQVFDASELILLARTTRCFF